MNAIGGRKFLLATFASLASVGLCAFGKLSGGEWVAAQSLILGLYKMANVAAQRFANTGAAQ